MDHMCGGARVRPKVRCGHGRIYSAAGAAGPVGQSRASVGRLIATEGPLYIFPPTHQGPVIPATNIGRYQHRLRQVGVSDDGRHRYKEIGVRDACEARIDRGCPRH